jgi:hypothetical protein
VANAALNWIAETVGAAWREGPTDDELLARFRQDQDGEAFAALVRRHGKAVIGAAIKPSTTPFKISDPLGKSLGVKLGNLR